MFPYSRDSPCAVGLLLNVIVMPMSDRASCTWLCTIGTGGMPSAITQEWRSVQQPIFHCCIRTNTDEQDFDYKLQRSTQKWNGFQQLILHLLRNCAGLLNTFCVVALISSAVTTFATSLDRGSFKIFNLHPNRQQVQSSSQR